MNAPAILSKAQIESKALEMYHYLDPCVVISSHMIPLQSLLNTLTQTHGVSWSLIPLNHDSKQMIYGVCDVENAIIYVEKELENHTDLLNFTLAHELGHLILHKDKALSDKRKKKLFSDTKSTLQYKFKLTTPDDWLEWQANYFAHSLLMPTQAFSQAITLYLEKKKWTLSELHHSEKFTKCLSHLQLQFGTSLTALSNRFHDIFGVEENTFIIEEQ